MSRTFSMNSGSVESLNVSTRCGRRANARQIRLIALWLSPTACAIDRLLQCVASTGFVSSVRMMTCSTAASVIVRGAPGRGSSSNPSSRFATNRARQRPTVWRVTRTGGATAAFGAPAAQASTIRARCASPCAVVGRRAHRSSVSVSSAVNTSGTLGRPRCGIGVPPLDRGNLRHPKIVP